MAKRKEVVRGLSRKGFKTREKTRHTFCHFYDLSGKKDPYPDLYLAGQG